MSMIQSRRLLLGNGHSVAVLRLLVLLWSAAILAMIIAAPLAASAARAEGWFLYEAFRAFCHQQADRSWHLQEHALAVCARCLGVYCGVLTVALSGLRLDRRAIGSAILVLAGSWAVEFTGLASVSNEIRWSTGLALGASFGGVLLARMGAPAVAPEVYPRPGSAP